LKSKGWLVRPKPHGAVLIVSFAFSDFVVPLGVDGAFYKPTGKSFPQLTRKIKKAKFLNLFFNSNKN